MDKIQLIDKSKELYYFNDEHFEKYLNYSRSITNDQIAVLEEFGILNNLDVRANNVKSAYIKSIKTKFKICCNIIPDYLCFESYCILRNIDPYIFGNQKTKILCQI